MADNANVITLESALEAIEPAPVREMIGEKLLNAAKLIRENNKLVLAIREAKDTDPNNVDYLDNVWKRVVNENADAEMAKAEARYQKAIAASEKELAFLRDQARAKHIQPPMSDEQIAQTKKLINEGKGAINTARIAAEQFAEMADKLIEPTGKGVEGGILSLLPTAESLLNTRGRKTASASSSDKPYSTRIVQAFVNGDSSNRTVKRKGEEVNAANFNFVAEDLSKMFGASQFPENGVASEEIEKAYYDSKGVEWREAGDMPEDHTFEFTKEIKVQNPNDDSTKVEPHTVPVRIIRWTKETAEAAKSDDKPTENAESAK